MIQSQGIIDGFLPNHLYEFDSNSKQTWYSSYGFKNRVGVWLGVPEESSGKYKWRNKQDDQFCRLYSLDSFRRTRTEARHHVTVLMISPLIVTVVLVTKGPSCIVKGDMITGLGPLPCVHEPLTKHWQLLSFKRIWRVVSLLIGTSWQSSFRKKYKNTTKIPY